MTLASFMLVTRQNQLENDVLYYGRRQKIFKNLKAEKIRVMIHMQEKNRAR